MHSVTIVYSDDNAVAQQCVRHRPPRGRSAYSGTRADDAARPKKRLNAALKMASNFSASAHVIYTS